MRAHHVSLALLVLLVAAFTTPGASQTDYLIRYPTAPSSTFSSSPSLVEYVAGGLPAGLIAFTASTCPTGWSEYTAAQGFAIVGLPSGGTAAGTVGVALTNQQDKSVTPTFSGSALAGHAHGTGTYATSAHSGTAVNDHASHTHTYTQVITHQHGLSWARGATTGGATTQQGFTSSQDTSSTAITQQVDAPTGAVSTGTTAGPGATLTHTVTQPSAHTLSGSSESLSAGTPAGTISAVTTSSTMAYIQLRACSKD